MTCRLCNTDENVRHYNDLDDPGWFCGPCHSRARQMDLIELGAAAVTLLLPAPTCETISP